MASDMSADLLDWTDAILPAEPLDVTRPRCVHGRMAERRQSGERVVLQCELAAGDGHTCHRSMGITWTEDISNVDDAEIPF